MSNHFVWITCRASGVAAMILVSAAVGVGVSISGRLTRGRGPDLDVRGADLHVTHEALSLAAFAMIALHGLSLLADSYFHPSLAALVVPLQRNYREPFMAIGIVGGWATILLGSSYYVRRLLGGRRWRLVHRFTVLAWVLIVIHAVGEGSDAGEAWFVAVMVVTIVPTVLLLSMRILGLRRMRMGRSVAVRRTAS
jgi:sulfoxide reductase heme-binding subunit YedZ